MRGCVAVANEFSRWFFIVTKTYVYTLCAFRQLAELYPGERTQMNCTILVQLREALAEAREAPENWVEYLQKGIRKLDTDLAASFKNLPVKGSPAGVEREELTALWCGF